MTAPTPPAAPTGGTVASAIGPAAVQALYEASHAVLLALLQHRDQLSGSVTIDRAAAVAQLDALFRDHGSTLVELPLAAIFKLLGAEQIQPGFPRPQDLPAYEALVGELDADALLEEARATTAASAAIVARNGRRKALLSALVASTGVVVQGVLGSVLAAQATRLAGGLIGSAAQALAKADQPG
jgi:hypothetical protein